MSLSLTGSQTVGPFFSIGLGGLHSHEVPAAPAEDGNTARRVEVDGVLLDGDNRPVPDAVLELWQSDAQGCYPMKSNETIGGGRCDGFARVAVDADGRFHFSTYIPGSVRYDSTRRQAPHLLVLVFMRGLLRNLVTRMYFGGEAANEVDPVLTLVPAERRRTLIALPVAPNRFTWTIILRAGTHAKDETVFFAW